MEKWSLAGEKSNWEPICSISKIQSFCCIPKIANKSLLSFLDIQMCFISSFTSERVDLPEDEREESVAMAEGYNYIKTLPSKQWAITLPRTLRSPACARARGRLLSLQQAFTYYPEQGWHLRRDVLSQTWLLLTPTVVWAARPAHHQLDCLGSHGDEMISPWEPQATSGNPQCPIKKSLRLDGYFEISHLFKEL